MILTLLNKILCVTDFSLLEMQVFVAVTCLHALFVCVCVCVLIERNRLPMMACVDMFMCMRKEGRGRKKIIMCLVDMIIMHT